MECRKKILVVFPHLPNPRMVKRVKALLTSYDVHVIYWDRDLGNKKINRLPREANVTVIRRKANEGSPLNRIGTTVRVIKEVVAIAKKVSPEVLYLSKTDMLFAGTIYHKLFRKNSKLIYEVSDLHTLMIDVKRQLHRKFISKILSMFEQTLCKSISLLVVTSENFYEQFYKKTVTLDKVIFMPNTPDPEVFSGFQRNHNDRFTVGFIGAVRYAEQLEMLIDVSVEANIDVLIAGGGKDYLRIKKYAETYENVKVYGEYKYDDEIKGLYEQVDCIYSVYDTKLTNVQIALPNRLYEAAYTATPLIASKNTYLAELVEKYEIGRTIAADSKSELIETILYLKHNPGYFKSIDENAEIFKNDWSFNKYNENLLEKIGNIV